MNLIILGLRRSGTTITWETFRQDPRLLSYNEPFNPLLRGLPGWNPRGAYTEFVRLVEEGPAEFWKRWAPIERKEELLPGLNDRQQGFFRYLLSQGEHVSVDLTRCHFKIEALHALAPDAVLVHLYRRPESHASSHLLPSRRDLRGRLRRVMQRSRFWTRATGFNFWGIEEIVGASTAGTFAQRLAETGLDPEEVYALPAVGKLLAYWRVNFEKAETDGRRYFGERFLSVPFEQFCATPQQVVERVYAAGGLRPPNLDYSRIHSANRGHEPDDPRWGHYLAKLGLGDAVGKEVSS